MPSRYMLTSAECSACGVNESHLAFYHGRHVHSTIVSDLSALSQAAKKAGFEFYMASAYRGFERQKAIWNSKFAMRRPVFDITNREIELSNLSDIDKVKAIMLFSALPGASRHHLGTDLDVFAKNLVPTGQSLQLEPWEYQQNGHQHEFSLWLDAHLATFGFYRPYDCYRGGVAAEPWHISHQLTASKLATLQSVDAIDAVLKRSDIKGKDAILANLSALHQQFITNVAQP